MLIDGMGSEIEKREKEMKNESLKKRQRNETTAIRISMRKLY